MLREMMKPRCKGQTVTIYLSKWGYQNYFVECTYYFDKPKDKYILSMWLNRNDMEDRMRVSSKKVDTQYLSGSKETIVENICRVVHHACLFGYFNHFIERYEYELACFARGNELFEQERLHQANDNEARTTY